MKSGRIKCVAGSGCTLATRSFRMGALLAAAALAFGITGMAKEAKNPDLKLDKVAEIRLVKARWRAPLDKVALQQQVSKLLDWYRADKLVPVKVEVFTGHELVKEIKKGPGITITPANQPKVRLWMLVKEKDLRVLVEDLETDSMKLMDLPDDGKLNMDFFE